MSNRKLWLAFIAVMVGSFAVLGYYGVEIYRKAPPVPERVVTTERAVVMTGQEIKDGQNVWQSLGGQEVGTVWGHGSYVAPDWSADWLHRESMYLLNRWAQQDFAKRFKDLDDEVQASLKVRLQKELRTNSYNLETGELVISPLRAAAFQAIGNHYSGLFTDDPDKSALREAYAIPENSIKDSGRLKPLNAFFFWTSWASSTNRPGKTVDKGLQVANL